MSDYILSCCSTADLSEEHLIRRKIDYVCFHFELDGVQYPDDLGKSMALSDFYKAMANGAETKTSQVNVEEYVEYFSNFLGEGKDILHISLSSGLSGSYSAACVAKGILEEKYPGRKIYIVDSLAASSGYGLIMDKLADLRDEGMSIDEARDWIEEHKLELHHWFFTTDLTFFIKGGRVSKTAGVFGTLLNICPLLNVDHEGRLTPRAKIRTKKKVIIAAVDKMEEFATDGLKYSGKCYISNSACYEDAKAVSDLVEDRFPKLNGKVLINDIGTTIGSHTGPGTVALFFWGKRRED